MIDKNHNGQLTLRNDDLMHACDQILVLGTGGTIAGLRRTTPQGSDVAGYTAAQVGITQLLEGLERAPSVIAEQICQIDSKDMSHEVWALLHARCCAAMLEPSIAAIVLTHGTDTMEETAFFLHASLCCTKPIVLTGAMRPSDAQDADGPANLTYALREAAQTAPGVWVAFANHMYPAISVQKQHPMRLDAFVQRVQDDAPDHGMAQNPCTQRIQPKACEQGPPPAQPARPFAQFPLAPKYWPRIEVVFSHAGADGSVVQALLHQSRTMQGGSERPLAGLVVAATGNGTVHAHVLDALQEAAAAGVVVWLSTNLPSGSVRWDSIHAFHTTPLPPAKARIALMLDLLSAVHHGANQ